MPPAIGIPGKPLIKRPEAKIQAQTTANAGFINSDGCIEKPKFNQRFAPLISIPKNKVQISKMKKLKKTRNDKRRICFGENIEIPNIKAIDGKRKNNCFLMKTKDVPYVFSETAGDAEKVRNIPQRIIAKIAQSNPLSKVLAHSIKKDFTLI